MTKNTNTDGKPRVNDEIILSGTVRLVYEDADDTDKSFNRIMDMSSARKLSAIYGLDLIEINGAISPPVIKMADYSKYIYRLKKAAKHKHNNVIKEIQLSVNIAEHDIAIKAKKARAFLQKGDKVKVILTFRGREMLRKEENKICLYKFIDMLSDISVPESMPKDDNNKSIVILKKK